MQTRKPLIKRRVNTSCLPWYRRLLLMSMVTLLLVISLLLMMGRVIPLPATMIPLLSWRHNPPLLRATMADNMSMTSLTSTTNDAVPPPVRFEFYETLSHDGETERLNLLPHRGLSSHLIASSNHELSKVNTLSSQATLDKKLAATSPAVRPLTTHVDRILPLGENKVTVIEQALSHQLSQLTTLYTIELKRFYTYAAAKRYQRKLYQLGLLPVMIVQAKLGFVKRYQVILGPADYIQAIHLKRRYLSMLPKQLILHKGSLRISVYHRPIDT